MNSLTTTHPLALNYLITEEIYAISEDSEVNTVEFTAVHAAARAEPGVAFTEKVKPPEHFEYLGENNKYMLIIINEVSHKNMQPKQLEALLSILKAKKMELKDVAILNFNNYPALIFTALKTYFACSSIILFGLNPAQIGIDGVQSNKIISHQGTHILATFSFNEMMTDIDKKRIFWNEMKKI